MTRTPSRGQRVGDATIESGPAAIAGDDDRDAVRDRLLSERISVSGRSATSSGNATRAASFVPPPARERRGEIRFRLRGRRAAATVRRAHRRRRAASASTPVIARARREWFWYPGSRAGAPPVRRGMPPSAAIVIAPASPAQNSLGNRNAVSQPSVTSPANVPAGACAVSAYANVGAGAVADDERIGVGRETFVALDPVRDFLDMPSRIRAFSAIDSRAS